MGTFIMEKPVSQFLRAQTAVVSPTKSFFTAIPQVGAVEGAQANPKDIKVDVYIRDEDGNSMPQKTVNLTTDLPSVVIEPSVKETDDLGKATFILKSSQVGTANINVEETTSGTKLTQKLSVEFTNQ